VLASMWTAEERFETSAKVRPLCEAAMPLALVWAVEERAETLAGFRSPDMAGQPKTGLRLGSMGWSEVAMPLALMWAVEGGAEMLAGFRSPDMAGQPRTGLRLGSVGWSEEPGAVAEAGRKRPPRARGRGVERSGLPRLPWEGRASEGGRLPASLLLERLTGWVPGVGEELRDDRRRWGEARRPRGREELLRRDMRAAGWGSSERSSLSSPSAALLGEGRRVGEVSGEEGGVGGFGGGGGGGTGPLA
jgi:hypothetical protein